ncbi:hypothetical protein Cgig2_025007 [Carnegiea gigantea]|uniref:Uncharacterized protein n=1 Tax=Carnegiea gigantea TaxID=171969 RepID=A0A9Q1GPC5_9CARY|nr:hypothetical protein Cgig2_025007 [Carnegiea gigantea]
MDGTLDNERALHQDGRECDYGPYYRCLGSLQSLNVIPSSTLTSILVRKVRIKQGTLCETILMSLFLRRSTSNVAKKKYILLMMNFIQPYIGSLLFHKVNHIYYDLWLDHFYREYLVYFAYEEQTNSEQEKVEIKKRSPICISHQEHMANLNATIEGELTALLALWLCCFVLAHGKEVIRPKTFVMVANIFSSNGAWLYLSRLMRGSKPSRLDTFSANIRIGWLADKLSLPPAGHVFRDGRYLSLRVSSCHENSRNVQDVIDMGLPNEDFKFLMFVRSSVLPGHHRSIMDLTHAHAVLQRDLLASGAQVSQSLSALHSMIDRYKLKIFGVVEAASKIEELLDVDWIKALSNQDLTCFSEIAHIEGDFEGGGWIHKIQEDLTIQQQSLLKVESKLKSSLYSKRREAEQVKADLIEAGFPSYMI